jgi:ribonuclease BN (tRNA processing enzyme)
MGSATITFLGTGDAFGSGGRLHTGLVIRGGGHTLVLDPGPCLLSQLQRARIAVADIDAVLITHLHGDHMAGLPFLFLDCQYRSRRRRPLIVIGPRGSASRLDRLAAETFREVSRSRRQFPVRYREIVPGDTTRVAGAAVEAFRMRHSKRELCLGYRVAIAGKVIAFTGDTGWCEELVSLARGVDVLLTECTDYTTQQPTHLNYRKLRQHAKELRARRVVLTHVGEELLRHRRRVRWPIARDGQTIRV